MKFKWFVQIVECNAAQNCSSQGICGPDGTCECDIGYYMEDCSGKLKIWNFVLNTVLLWEKLLSIKTFVNLRQEGQELIHKTILFQQGKIRIIHETEYVLVLFIIVIE